jgi:hypothetical protein
VSFSNRVKKKSQRRNLGKTFYFTTFTIINYFQMLKMAVEHEFRPVLKSNVTIKRNSIQRSLKATELFGNMPDFASSVESHVVTRAELLTLSALSEFEFPLTDSFSNAVGRSSLRRWKPEL